MFDKLDHTHTYKQLLEENLINMFLQIAKVVLNLSIPSLSQVRTILSIQRSC